MSTDLEKYLLQFKELTLNMIKAIKKEEFNLLEKLMDERQLVINKMQGLSYTQEEFKSIGEKLNILSEDKMLNKLLSEKKDEIKKQLAEINNVQRVNNKYKKHIYQNNGIFSTKI